MYYTKNTTLYLNGKFIKAVDATTDLYSQTLHYGYGVFEGIRAYQTQNGTKIRVKGKGFPAYKQEDIFGDLYVTYNVKLPTALNEKEIALFEELRKLNEGL